MEKNMKEKTGYPSKDLPWLQYYDEGVFEKAMNTPKDTSVYSYFKNNVFTDPNFEIMKYFNNSFTTNEVLEMIAKWAWTFLELGIEPDEMVPIYGTVSPETALMFMALNAIGAHPYYEKLDITEKALIEETAGSKLMIVEDVLLNPIVYNVMKKFKNAIVVGAADSMLFPTKQLMQVKTYFDLKKMKLNLAADNVIFADRALEIGSHNSGKFEVDFKPNRLACITSSSGTSSAAVKGIMDTNESVLANIIGTSLGKPTYIAGKECFTTLPLTASTCLNCFYLLPLLNGMSVRFDPRADLKSWTKSVLKYKPSLSSCTGSAWLYFIKYLEEQDKKGKKFDLSFMDCAILGGSGVNPIQLKRIEKTLKEHNAKDGVFTPGYGMSEVFGVLTVEKMGVPNPRPNDKDVISVGLPIPGAIVGVFDENGNELPYGKRGELRVKGPFVMHGYFNKPELTAKTIKDGWVYSGDICEIDENGFVYCYGRMKNSVEINNKKIYLFDIANRLLKEFELEDCMAEVKKLSDGSNSIVIYFVQGIGKSIDSSELCKKMDYLLRQEGIVVDGYRESEGEFEISPTTLKPQTRYLDGFVKYDDNGEYEVSYSLTDKTDVLDKHVKLVKSNINCKIIENA